MSSLSVYQNRGFVKTSAWKESVSVSADSPESRADVVVIG